ncbi:MAG: biotin/lipoyl-binding protein, partial [Burkholderiaceae bacterium]|nr:biotin/lipoyl-binding protein [Burkholderiaceae bacterium]
MQHTHQPSTQRHHSSAAVQAATHAARAARVKRYVTWTAVLVCGACVYAASNAAHGAEANAVAPPLVRTTAFQDAWVYPTVTVAAQVQARNTAQVAAQVGGVVQSWRADTGASVRRGDVLAQLDPQDLSLALAQAKAQQQAAAAQMALSEQQLVR